MNEPPLHAGRPREQRLDEALLEAGLEVFLERGYHGATFAEIARRAGVGTPAMYRRWSTKAALAIDLVVRESEPEPIPDTGSIRNDLTEFVRLRLRTMSKPLFMHVLLPVVIEAGSDPRLSQEVRDTFNAYREPSIVPRIRKAVADGELVRETDPNRLADMLGGTIVLPLLFSQDLPDDKEARRIVDGLLDGFAHKDGHAR